MNRPISPEPGAAAVPNLAARRRAILCVLASAATFAIAAAAVKALGGRVPVMQIVLFRNLFAILPLLALLWYTTPMRQRGWVMLATRNPWSHVQRVGFGLFGMIGSFYAYNHLPLATVTALGFTMPLFLTALSIPLLGETVGWRRLSAVAIGFIGVLILLGPGLSSGGALHWPAVAATLGGSVTWALAMITIRRMGAQGESGASIVLWFAIGGALVGLVASLPVWVWPRGVEWLLLAAVGLVSALAQLFMTAAYRSGEATLIAPFEYSGILWTSLLGLLLWGEALQPWTMVGVAVLVASGLYIWHRETRARR